MFMMNDYFHSLAIGYGNPLRCDDGAGARAAEILQRMNIPGLRVIVSHQLLPEHAELISRANLVFFIDAGVDLEQDGISAFSLTPAYKKEGVGHTGDPRELLALAQGLYGCIPEAWMVILPARNFEFGETISTITKQGINDGVEYVAKMCIQGHSPCMK
jgi:hydrogenase maturation protease